MKYFERGHITRPQHFVTFFFFYRKRLINRAWYRMKKKQETMLEQDNCSNISPTGTFVHRLIVRHKMYQAAVLQKYFLIQDVGTGWDPSTLLIF